MKLNKNCSKLKHILFLKNYDDATRCIENIRSIDNDLKPNLLSPKLIFLVFMLDNISDKKTFNSI